MRILIIHRYYHPDAGAYASMLKIMARRFAEAGHDVSVFSTQPSYSNVDHGKLPGRMVTDGVEENRAWLIPEKKSQTINRIANVFLFIAQLVIHCLTRFGKYDLMTVASFPPTMPAMIVRWVSWLTGAKYLYHCQDIYPEIGLATGVIKRPWLAKLATYIDKKNCRNAAAIVTLSNDMVQTLVARGIPDSNMSVINNFIIDQFDPDVTTDPEFKKPANTFRVLFAGNMGRFQNLPRLIDAANTLKTEPQIHFYFVGTGAIVGELEQQADLLGLLNKTVFFRPFQPLDKVMRIIRDSDLSIISLAPSVIDCAYPSKTMTYAEAGCRMLAMVEIDSELAQLVRSQNLGVATDGNSSHAIASAVKSEYDLWKRPDYANAVSPDSIREIGRELFGQETILNQWLDLLDNLSRE